MEEELITFETAKLSKDKGFDLKVKNWFDISWHPFIKKNPIEWESSIFVDFNSGKTNQFSRPTQSLIQRWLRDKHNILIDICAYYKEEDLPLNSPRKPEGYFCWDPYNEEFYEELAPKFKTFEEALEFGLQEALDMLKNTSDKIDSVSYD